MPSRTNNRTEAAAGKVGEVFQPRAGERSEVEGGLASGVRLALRAIPPPVPILPREVEKTSPTLPRRAAAQLSGLF